MILKTAELRQFSALVLIPPGNIQNDLSGLVSAIAANEALSITKISPPWLFCKWLDQPISQTELVKFGQELPDLTALDSWYIRTGGLYLGSAISDTTLTDTELPPFRQFSILCGLFEPASDASAQKIATTATLPPVRLAFRSASLACLSGYWRTQPPIALSWQIRCESHVKLRWNQPDKTNARQPEAKL